MPFYVDDKGVLTESMEQAAAWDKSPKIRGFVEGLKAGLMAAPVGGTVQAIRGKNIVHGALGTGVAAGLLVGGLAAAIQKVKNLREEADLRFYTQNMIEREPAVFMPPPPPMRPLPPRFATGFGNVYR